MTTTKVPLVGWLKWFFNWMECDDTTDTECDDTTDTECDDTTDTLNVMTPQTLNVMTPHTLNVMTPQTHWMWWHHRHSECDDTTDTDCDDTTGTECDDNTAAILQLLINIISSHSYITSCMSCTQRGGVWRDAEGICSRWLCHIIRKINFLLNIYHIAVDNHTLIFFLTYRKDNTQC